MKIPAEKWHQAIQVRRSRRRFIPKPVPPETLKHLADFSVELNNFIKGARAVPATDNPDQVFTGIAGSSGKVKGALAYAAFIGDVRDPKVREKVGYLGECFILEATSLGLATCWVGGMFDPAAVGKQIALADYEKVFAVTPVGYAKEEYSLGEKLMSGLAGSRKRKDLAGLCSGLARNKWPDWARSALAAARLAPSAVNRQPWRFTVAEKAITVSVDNPNDYYQISKRLDCGIAMVHLEVGALVKGVRGQWEYLNAPEVAKFEVKV